jgi:hypothetical protein
VPDQQLVPGPLALAYARAESHAIVMAAVSLAIADAGYDDIRAVVAGHPDPYGLVVTMAYLLGAHLDDDHREIWRDATIHGRAAADSLRHRIDAHLAGQLDDEPDDEPPAGPDGDGPA